MYRAKKKGQHTCPWLWQVIANLMLPLRYNKKTKDDMTLWSASLLLISMMIDMSLTQT